MQNTWTICRLLTGLLFVCLAAGQDQPGPGGPTSAQPTPPAEDALGRSTPHGAVLGFMRAYESEDMDRAIQYLDTDGDEEESRELADELGSVLNQATKLDIGSLSRLASGELNDGLRKNRELAGVASVDSNSVEILLDLVERSDEPPIWLFSSETLSAIPSIASQVDGLWQEEYLPRFLVEQKFFSVQLYRWIAAPAAVLVILAGSRLLVFLLAMVLRPLMAGFAGQSDDSRIASLASGPLRLLIFSLMIRAADNLAVTALARLVWGTAAAILITISVAWLLVRMTRTVAEIGADHMRSRNAPEKIALVKLGGRLGQIVVALSAVLVIVRIVGVELTGILAGLGLGGVALALGAQKTLENFLGGAMIIWDAPVRVGDYCRIGEYVGIVEDIGLRSTRMRTLDRSVVSIPNAQLSVMSIENITGRDKMRFHHTLELGRETTLEQLQSVMDRTHETLREQPNVEPESARVRFAKVGQSSLDIDLQAYVLETTPSAFLLAQEQILLRVVAGVEACGAQLALPALLNYNASESVAERPDLELAKQTERVEPKVSLALDAPLKRVSNKGAAD